MDISPNLNDTHTFIDFYVQKIKTKLTPSYISIDAKIMRKIIFIVYGYIKICVISYIKCCE